MGVTDQPAAFYFDRAVFIFGSTLESELEKVGEAKGKRNAAQAALARQQVMARWLRQRRFAEPPRR